MGMRRARKKIQPRIGIQGKFGGAIYIRVGQRSNARPILRRTIRIENLGKCFRLSRFPQQAVPRSSYGVQLIAIREWKKVHRLQVAQNRVSSLSRCSVAMIEAAPPGATARHEHSIKGLPSSLIGGESLIKILAEQPGALRVAVAQDILLGLGVLSQ